MTDGQKIYLQFGIGAIVAVALGVVMVMASDYENAQVEQAGYLQISENMYDFGKIPINGGNVQHEYTLENIGEGPIKIQGMKTSCMCTTAVITYNDGSMSPKFGMHNNPAFYSKSIQPGETAVVTTTFDPMFHGPSGTGFIRRSIDIFTNKENYRIGFSAEVTP